MAEIGKYELIKNTDVRAVLGDRNPSRYQMERNNWQLARDIGRSLHADYVMVVERWGQEYPKYWYFLASLINVESGAKFEAENQNPASLAFFQVASPIFDKIFQDAKNDLIASVKRNMAQMQKAGEVNLVKSGSLVTAVSQTSAPNSKMKKIEQPAGVIASVQAVNKTVQVDATKEPSPPEPKKVEQQVAMKETASKPVPAPITKVASPPVIYIASPDRKDGTKTITTSKIIVAGKITAESGVSEVTINGKDADLDRDGNFSAEIFLKMGKNEITVVAVDTQGQKGTQTFTIERQKQLVAKQEVTPPVITIVSPDRKKGTEFITTSKIVVAGKATAESGISDITINGKDANLDKDGNFSAEILLKMGENEITVVAIDTQGQTGTQTFKVNRQSQQIAQLQEERRPPSLLKTGKYYALIIGNDNYKYLPNLETAKKDASAIEHILKTQYNFETRLLINATRNDILDAINYFRKILNENDNFLIYYAGHGEYDKRADKAYWLPVDAQMDSDTNWIIADDLTVNMKRILSRHILVVADSCYSGTLTRGVFINLKTEGDREAYLIKMYERPSRTLIASGGNEPVSDTGGSGHSAFADAFLKALVEVDNKTFTAEEVFYGYIKERVAGRAEQVPEYNTIRNSGHDGGDFIFEKK
jgi:hypothetical protein